MANPPAKAPLRANTFGPFAHDPNRTWMNGFPNYFITSDAAGTTSPIASVSNSAAQEIKIPAGAVTINITTTTILQVSSDPAMGSYDLMLANTTRSFPVVTPDMNNVTANTGSIYIKSDTTAARVGFSFECV